MAIVAPSVADAFYSAAQWLVQRRHDGLPAAVHHVGLATDTSVIGGSRAEMHRLTLYLDE